MRLSLKLLGAGTLSALALHLFPEVAGAQEIAGRTYGDFPFIGGRVAVWGAAQIHLLFAAFVLGVPMFAVVAEAVGMFGGDAKYDKLAKEFTRLLLVAYSATAIWGAILSFLLITIFPNLWIYLAEIFEVSMWIYVGLFFFESFTLYLYYYGWDRWNQGRAKLGPLGIGALAERLWHGGDAHRQLVADVHDESAGGGDFRHAGKHGRRVGRLRERDLDAHQHPPGHRQPRVRWSDRGRLRGLPFPGGQDR